MLKYLIKNGDAKKLQQISNKLVEQKPIVSKEFYFQLLKEDKLEMLELYLTLKQQLRCTLNSSKVYDNNLILSNVPLLLNFEKLLGINDFANMIEEEL